MDEFESKSKVYIQTDAQGRILRCEGGYTMSNIGDISEWIFIDEGTGDRYNLCQSQYFDGGLYTEDGICRWVYENEACRLRTEAEIEAALEAAGLFWNKSESYLTSEHMYEVLYEMEVAINANS